MIGWIGEEEGWGCNDCLTSPRSVLCCWPLSSRGSIRDLLRAVSHSATSLNSALSICYSMCVRDRETESLCLYSPPCLGSQFLSSPFPPSLSPFSVDHLFSATFFFPFYFFNPSHFLSHFFYFSVTLPLSFSPPSLRPPCCVCLWRC